MFRNWPSGLGPKIELASLALPGRERRYAEPLERSIDELAQKIARFLEREPGPPFAFFGHSLGAMLAFEVARNLEREGLPGPVHFFASGARAPQLPDPNQPLHVLGEAEFRRALRELGGTPREVLEHEELMGLLSPVLRADFEMLETYEYRPGTPLSCPLTVFGGRFDEVVSLAELRAWEACSSVGSELVLFEGDHFFLAEHEPQLLAEIKTRLVGTGQ